MDSSSGPAVPVDLEMRVTTRSTREGLELQFTLKSPSGAVPNCFHRDAGSRAIGSEAVFSAQMDKIFRQLENLSEGHDTEGGALLHQEVENELENIGHGLYDRLFSKRLQSDYGEFREQVNTWLIVSDDRWSIPWELIRPFGSEFADEPLGIRYQLSRWLAGGAEPAHRIEARRARSLGAGGRSDLADLPSAEEEHRMISSLWADESEVEADSLPSVTHDRLREILKTGELDLIHFVGHGDYASDQPEESSIALEDRAFRARDLTGPLQLALRASRPLVFYNACRVARQGWWLSGLGGWAQAWVLGCGCGAFIGPQWAVRDRSALRFATVFYEELQGGRTLGEALQQARTRLKAESPGNLAWAAYVGFSHPNARLLGKSGAEGSSTSPPGIPIEIRNRFLDFSRLITEKTESFVGREWLLDRVSRFLEERPRGYFLLRGDPGIGKSSFAAEIVRRHGCVHHFNIRAEGIDRFEHFLANVCAQLIATFRLPRTFLPPEATRDGVFFKVLLEEIVQRHPGEKVLIVVDALDESLPIRDGINPLYLPSILPEGVYIVATSRRTIGLNSQTGLEVLDLQQDDEGNLADVRLLVEAWAERDGIRAYVEEQELAESQFVGEMVDKSQGNFMYLRCVLPEIETGFYRTREFDRLPHGLEAYYQDHWVRMKSRDEDRWFDYQLPVLVALTVVKEPISLDLVASFSQVEGRSRIRRVLQEWDAFLYRQTVTDEASQTRQDRYRIYHDSFHDFIAQKEEVADERVDRVAAHGRIADVLWKELFD